MVAENAPDPPLNHVEVEHEVGPREDHARHDEQFYLPGVEGRYGARARRVPAGRDGRKSVVYGIERPHPGEEERDEAPGGQPEVDVGEYLGGVRYTGSQPLGHRAGVLGAVELRRPEPDERRDRDEEDDDAYPPDPLRQAAPEQHRRRGVLGDRDGRGPGGGKPGHRLEEG